MARINSERNPRVISVNDANAGLKVTQTGTGIGLEVNDSNASFEKDLYVGNVGVGVADRYNQAVIQSQQSPAVLRQVRADTNLTTLVESDVVSQLLSVGYDGTAWKQIGSINLTVDGAVSTGVIPTRYSFFITSTAGINNTELLRLNSSLNIGIRATSKLHFDGVGAAGDTYISETSANNLKVFAGGAERANFNATGIGFNGATPVAKPTITGSRGGNAAIASLLTALANLGLITDSTTA